MLATVNQRISRSGLTVSSSPIRSMGKQNQTSPHSSSSTHKPEQGTDANICSMQDLWGFISNLHNTLMKQSEDIKNLALQNQELEHKIHLQDLRITSQDNQIHDLQNALNTQTENTRNVLAKHDEKLDQIAEKTPQTLPGTAETWAEIISKKPAALNFNDTHMKDTLYGNMYGHVDDTEHMEQEKRKMNMVIRGIPESETEQVLTLNADITDMIATKFGMQDVVIYGAHRVGKKQPEKHRAIVCTMLDARKRAIILENARIYLKDSPMYISEDRTPNQQKARREAYEARTNKKTPQNEVQETKT